MGKDRKSKRQLIRDEKKAKKRAREVDQAETNREKKRQRGDGGEDGEEFALDATAPTEARAEAGAPRENGNDIDYPMNDADGELYQQGGPTVPEREFFGMLADEEQEYFRSADEKLETNDFESDEDRGYFLQSLYREAVGKELKLASSQSCSRLMERLILLSNTKQKKRLFEAFAGHFVTLVTHRFASHCCEKLFIQSAPVVSRELGGMEDEEEEVEEVQPEQDQNGEGEQASNKASMEELFLLTLDELEEHLSYLLSDKFGSHALRVLLVVLSGRPLEQVATKSLLQSKKKEHITVQGGSAETAELNAHIRVVPESFSLAMQKILEDTTASMDTTALRVLATHPTGNPVLQLLVELDLSLNGKDKDKKDRLLLLKLIPGAPETLGDNTSPAADFVNSMMYDPVGSRLLETIITHAPAKIFKALTAHFFSPRINTYVRNDIACYPAIKALNRMSKDDLRDAVGKIIPEVPKLVASKRLNVLKALFDRCHVRQVKAQIAALLEAVCAAYGGSSDGAELVPKLCGLVDDESDTKKKATNAAEAKEIKYQPSLHTEKQKAAAISHGCQLVTTLLNIPGGPAQAMQTSLLALSSDQLFHLATTTTPSMIVIKTALAAPPAPETPNFHKGLVSKLAPRMVELAQNKIGHNIVNEVIHIPSKAAPASAEVQTGVIPFHLKETIMTTLGGSETQLRDTWTGRSVWRTWKGDQWKFRRSDWIRFAKEVDPQYKSEDKLWNKVAEQQKLKMQQQKREKGRWDNKNGEMVGGEAF
ncbi:armadillo-type protein [Coniella lustricola]|uniref:Nucleolar protein 9 n=1 Tax=Coniella lustricola TaxID=2025994 RepID=A0A2T3AHP5_9PEZI|nr:armadillo-type protein [Coniella lustricola]